MSDKKVRIQDDLYMYVNKEWLDSAVIPDDKPATGGFNTLADDVEKLLIADFNKMAEEGGVEDSNLKKAVDLFSLAKNMEKRDAEGFKPLLPSLERIKNLDSVQKLNDNLAELVLSRVELPFALFVDTDMKQSTKHAMFLAVPDIILPDTTFYQPEMKEQHDALLGVWSQMVTALLAYTPLSPEEQKTYLENAIKFDAILATLVKSREEQSEYTKMYNPMPTEEVAKKLLPIDLNSALSKLEKVPETIIVTEPRYLDGFNTVLNEETYPLYQSWAYIKCILNSTSYLSAELRQIGSIYSNTLTGVKSLPTAEVQAYRLASSLISEPVGLYYGRKYFGEEAKKDVIEIVKEIISAYKVRVEQNDFLSRQTKDKAISKLDKIVIKMGYPDKADEIYDKLDFDRSGSLLDAIESIRLIFAEDRVSKLYKDVNREEWVMPGHMVNACYNPTSNDITFPAAILQAPFYSIKQTRSQNLGGIGAVIGHEISHAFDNNGAKCDEDGNLNNWWTEEDFAAFEEKTKDMIAEFEGIELPWGKVNATLTVSENIADNGGMAVTLHIMRGMKDANYQEYFINWAKVWCIKARPEYLQLLLSVDVHGPSVLRANMPPRNFPEWYTAFDVTEDDEMYIAPEKRVVIW